MKRYLLGSAVSLLIITGLAVLVIVCRARDRKYRAREFFTDETAARLAEAARDGDIEEVDSLISKGASANAKGRGGLSVLLYSMSGNTLSGFRRLLERGANPNQQDDLGQSPMSWASCRRTGEALKLLLAHGGDPNLRVPDRMESFTPTPIFNAAESYVAENVSILISAGADANARDYLANTPLIAAARLDSFDPMYVLLEAGADFRAKDRLGYTVIHELLRRGEPTPEVYGGRMGSAEVASGRQRCIEFLRKKGVDFEEEKRNDAEVARQIRREEEGRRKTKMGRESFSGP